MQKPRGDSERRIVVPVRGSGCDWASRDSRAASRSLHFVAECAGSLGALHPCAKYSLLVFARKVGFESVQAISPVRWPNQAPEPTTMAVTPRATEGIPK